MTIDQIIEVLQAAKAGKQIERERETDLSWYDIDINEWISFLAPMRVKPEPREGWILRNHLVAYKPSGYSTEEYIHVREVLE